MQTHYQSLAAWTLLVLGHVAEGAAKNEQQILRSGGVVVDATSKMADKVRNELKHAEIIPTVIDDFLPALELHASWSSKQQASLGNALKPEKLQDAPSVTLHDASESSRLCTSRVSYVITLTDPDAPSRDDPKWSEMCHWIATGVSASATANRNAAQCLSPAPSDLDDVMPYKAPGPPEKTGKHRYVFIAFAAENGTTERLYPSKPADRQHWGYDTDDGETKGVRDWARENGLVPVAANFIYAKNKKQ
ncbi:phosphatidylethanolamine-binding protein [Lasiosphaeria hispida]|uniref:Phosphatidylethanolamine-binding protein n=1 Tax=Lasiosphaeria hispida TaxID=260671 RepID=A0AAJ0HQG5_9PEZI|nr:phosphatidylethanolamine-binding protein [Lasiosphaeria hispida]